MSGLFDLPYHGCCLMGSPLYKLSRISILHPPCKHQHDTPAHTLQTPRPHPSTASRPDRSDLCRVPQCSSLNPPEASRTKNTTRWQRQWLWHSNSSFNTNTRGHYIHLTTVHAEGEPPAKITSGNPGVVYFRIQSSGAKGGQQQRTEEAGPPSKAGEA